MSSSDSSSFDTNGLEKIQYKTTTTDDDGFAETKVLTIFFEEELRDKVPTKSMLDDSWELVEDNENTTEDNEIDEPQTEETTAAEIDDSNQKRELAKLAFQSPIPTFTKLSISSKMPPSTLLVAKSA